MPYARTDDRVRIYYEEHGAGSPLVLAYGIGGNTDMWNTNTAALAARHRVILWEPRGHARSDSPEDPARYSFHRWALDLRDLLDHLRIRKAHVGGLSLGAGIATRLTLKHPDRVSALIVVDSSSAAGLPLSPDKRRVVIYDQLNPAYAKYYTREEACALLARHGFDDIRLHHRHGISWTVVGTRP